MRTAEEIRSRINKRVQSSLARGAMFGRDSEVYMREFLSMIAFIDQRDKELAAHFGELKTSGAFNASGVRGGFVKPTGTWGTDGEIGSVYAVIALKMGYLETDRLYSNAELGLMKESILGSIDQSDLTTEAFFEKFGLPSWPNSKPGFYYPRTYLYLTVDPKIEFIACDFFNKAKFQPNGGPSSGIYGNLPRLRNIRTDHPEFEKQFVFTKFGDEIVKTFRSKELKSN